MTHAAPSLGVPTGRWSPYTYPPTAAVVFALVAALPALAGFLVTQAVGLVTFFSGIARLAAPEWRLWLVALGVPIAGFNIPCGQNGLLSAGIAAHAIELLLARRPVGSGLVAALATLKPHLALGVPALLVARREGRGLIAVLVPRPRRGVRRRVRHRGLVGLRHGDVVRGSESGRRDLPAGSLLLGATAWG